jgi:hypothetical protein
LKLARYIGAEDIIGRFIHQLHHPFFPWTSFGYLSVLILVLISKWFLKLLMSTSLPSLFANTAEAATGEWAV